MHVVNLGKGYQCHGCDLVFTESEPTARTKLADTYYEGTNLEDVETYTQYYCHDPEGACEISDEDWSYVETVYECGDCDTKYADFASAVACCK